MQKKAVILFSGGVDSSTCLAMANATGFECYALSFNYGQKQLAELEGAKRTAKTLGAKAHRIVTLPLGEIGGSALTNSEIQVSDHTRDEAIPNTYEPARNVVFLSVALAWAEVLGAFDIFIGANAIDYPGYPDCRPEFLTAFEKMANVATKAGVEGKYFKIHAPLVDLKKYQIIQEGMKLGVDYGMTFSCYRLDDEGKACGRCDSCMYRKKGFLEAGVSDPTRYK